MNEEEKYLIIAIIIIICATSIILVLGFAFSWLGNVSNFEMWEKMGGSTITSTLIFIIVVIIGISGYFAYNYYQEHSGR